MPGTEDGSFLRRPKKLIVCCDGTHPLCDHIYIFKVLIDWQEHGWCACDFARANTPASANVTKNSDSGWKADGFWGEGHMQTPSNVTRISRAIHPEDRDGRPQVLSLCLPLKPPSAY